MKEMIIGLMEMEIANRIYSKVEGRRNWVIRVQNDCLGNRNIYYCGGFGDACRRGVMSAMIKDIRERKIRWYEFTYKKDYLEALKILKENGIF